MTSYQNLKREDCSGDVFALKSTWELMSEEERVAAFIVDHEFVLVWQQSRSRSHMVSWHWTSPEPQPEVASLPHTSLSATVRDIQYKQIHWFPIIHYRHISDPQVCHDFQMSCDCVRWHNDVLCGVQVSVVTVEQHWGGHELGSTLPVTGRAVASGGGNGNVSGSSRPSLMTTSQRHDTTSVRPHNNTCQLQSSQTMFQINSDLF